MDIFFLSWAFDSRWFFKIKNPCRQLVFTIPFIINMISLIVMYIQKSFSTDQHLAFITPLTVVLAMLALSNLYVIFIIRMNSTEKVSQIKTNNNYMAIQAFYHEYETKKIIWSFIGLIVTIVAIIQTVLQDYYISKNQRVYACNLNKFRFYLDIACYSYIGLNILVFLLVKAVYLISAWVCCPKFYLKIKKIID